MNTGAISSRYAKALFKLVCETGRGDAVCAQVRQILACPDEMPQVLEPDLESFIQLLVRNGRMEYVRFILSDFVHKYHEAHGIRVAHLVTAVPAPGLEDKLRGILREYTLIFDSKVDPDLIGGFVLTVDDMMMDASVKSQIELIRRQFVEKNRRII